MLSSFVPKGRPYTLLAHPEWTYAVPTDDALYLSDRYTIWCLRPTLTERPDYPATSGVYKFSLRKPYERLDSCIPSDVERVWQETLPGGYWDIAEPTGWTFKEQHVYVSDHGDLFGVSDALHRACTHQGLTLRYRATHGRVCLSSDIDDVAIALAAWPHETTEAFESLYRRVHRGTENNDR